MVAGPLFFLGSIAGPATRGVLRLDEPLDGPTSLRAVELCQIAKYRQHTSGSVDRIFFILVVLIAEPKRNPTAIVSLLICQILLASFHCLGDPHAKFLLGRLTR